MRLLHGATKGLIILGLNILCNPPSGIAIKQAREYGLLGKDILVADLISTLNCVSAPEHSFAVRRLR